MKEKLLLRKTCSIYANDLHFATVMFPYLTKQIKNAWLYYQSLLQNCKISEAREVCPVQCIIAGAPPVGPVEAFYIPMKGAKHAGP